MSATPVRRTQEQRRTETIGKLVEATIESIEQVGYHRTSLGEICARSGVSKGGLFRHFGSRLDLIIAAAEEVAARHSAAFDDLRADGVPLGIDDILAFARARIRHETNVVWFEVLVAARTEPDLRERLAPITQSLYEMIEARAVANFEGLGLPEDLVRLAVTSAIHMFDGETIVSYSYPRPEVEAARMKSAVELFTALGKDLAAE
ncbi:TetR/AcrR family transcriptional regulator [Nocardioides stalactiti]|uniref:TetR/AcrR family transcriptional regulator n=1 Tax=Nocardioides stalactiti TaxID=2755356 RepID=UPI0016032AC1|nr:TetR/AcrR family transcriptional regulator [Nocardioides stalactiti]